MAVAKRTLSKKEQDEMKKKVSVLLVMRPPHVLRNMTQWTHLLWSCRRMSEQRPRSTRSSWLPSRAEGRARWRRSYVEESLTHQKVWWGSPCRTRYMPCKLLTWPQFSCRDPKRWSVFGCHLGRTRSSYHIQTGYQHGGCLWLSPYWWLGDRPGHILVLAPSWNPSRIID